MAVTFEWDPVKDEENRSKHGVAFSEALTAFGDSLSITVSDPDHSTGERRFLLLGQSSLGRLVVVVHADRQDRIRIISARIADRRERRNYEEG